MKMIAFMVSGAIFSLTPFAPAQGPSTAPDLIAAALSANGQAFHKVRSVSYDFETTYERLIPPKISITITGRVLRDGLLQAVSYVHNETDDGVPIEATEYRSVLNNDYFGTWIVGDGGAYEYLHDSIASQSNRSKEASHMMMGDDWLMNASFGVEGNLLNSLIDVDSRFEWTASQDPGADRTIEIRRSLKPMRANQPPDLAVDISPREGYLITRWILYERGIPDLEVSVDARQLGPTAAWFPTAIHSFQYDTRGVPQHVKPAVCVEEDTKLFNVTLNPPIHPDDFTLAALKVPDGTPLTKIFPTGGGSSSKVRAGEDN